MVVSFIAIFAAGKGVSTIVFRFEKFTETCFPQVFRREIFNTKPSILNLNKKYVYLIKKSAFWRIAKNEVEENCRFRRVQLIIQTLNGGCAAGIRPSGFSDYHLIKSHRAPRAPITFRSEILHNLTLCLISRNFFYCFINSMSYG
jgi:hypothetical protein